MAHEAAHPPLGGVRRRPLYRPAGNSRQRTQRQRHDRVDLRPSVAVKSSELDRHHLRRGAGLPLAQRLRRGRSCSGCVPGPQGPPRPRQDPAPSTVGEPRVRNGTEAYLRRRDHRAPGRLDHLHDGDRDLITCALDSSSPSTADFKLGQHVKVECAGGKLVTIAAITQADAGRYYVGVVNAVDGSGLTLQTEHGPVTCTIGAGSPSTAELHVGDKIGMGCKASTMQLVLIRKLDGGDTPPPPTTTTPTTTPRPGHAVRPLSFPQLIGVGERAHGRRHGDLPARFRLAGTRRSPGRRPRLDEVLGRRPCDARARHVGRATAGCSRACAAGGVHAS